MSRYTEYLKEKVLCKYCDCIISKGHRETHLKSLKHINNLTKEFDQHSKN